MKKNFGMKLELSNTIVLTKQFAQREKRGVIVVNIIEWTVFTGSISAMTMYFLIALIFN